MAARRAASNDALLEPLERAALALSNGDGAVALDALLAAWRLRRIGALGELVERLSKRLPVPPVSTATDGKARMLAFAERAHPRRAADVGPLVDDFREVFPTVQGHLSVSRAKILKQLDPDPRIGAFARWAVNAFNDMLYPASQLQKLLSGLGKAHADDDKAPRPDEALAVRLLELTAKIDAATLKPIELTVAAPDADSVVGLLQSVYADPTNDDLRQVVGDRLVELGDPRGELIALQYRQRVGTLDDAGRKRIESLLRKHLDAWLGPLAPFAVKKRTLFDRGFPVRIDSTVNRVFKRKQAVLLPEWSTVEELDHNEMSFVTPAMRCLRVVRNLHADGLADLIALETPPPLEHLELSIKIDEADGTNWATVLPRLQRLAWLEIDVRSSLNDSAAEEYVRTLAALAPHLPPSCAALCVRWPLWAATNGAGMEWVAQALELIPSTVTRFVLSASWGAHDGPPLSLVIPERVLAVDVKALMTLGISYGGRMNLAGLGSAFKALGARVQRLELVVAESFAALWEKNVGEMTDELRRQSPWPVSRVDRPG